jgi:hypothetical protein
MTDEDDHPSRKRQKTTHSRSGGKSSKTKATPKNSKANGKSAIQKSSKKKRDPKKSRRIKSSATAE